MASESVKFIISAENRAEAEFRKTQKELERTAGSVKKFGSETKTSAELVRTLAQQMGGSWLGTAAGEVGELTERLSAMSDIGAKSNLAMSALKITIATAVIGTIIKLGLEVKKQIDGFYELAAATEAAQAKMMRMAAIQDEIARKRFTHEIAKISLLESEEEQEKRLRQMVEKIRINLFKSSQTLEMHRERLVGLKGDTAMGYQSDAHKEKIKAQELVVQLAQQEVDKLRSQRDLIQDKLTFEKELAAIQDARAEKEKAAMDAKTAELEKQKQYEKERLAIEEQKRLASEKVAAIERKKNELISSQVESMKLQLVELRDGKKVADTLRYTMQGIDEATAKQLAAVEATIDGLRGGSDTGSGPRGGPSGPLAALESRFLSGRMVTTDYTKVAAENTKQTAENTKLQLAKMDSALAQLELIASYTSNQIEEAR